MAGTWVSVPVGLQLSRSPAARTCAGAQRHFLPGGAHVTARAAERWRRGWLASCCCWGSRREVSVAAPRGPSRAPPPPPARLLTAPFPAGPAPAAAAKMKVVEEPNAFG